MRHAERREQSQANILAGALALLEQVGFSRLRVADVADASGMSVGTLFRYFPTKNELIRSSLQASLDEHQQRITKGLRSLRPSFARRAVFELLCDCALNPRRRWTYELFAAASHELELGEFIHDVVAEHQTVMNHLLRSALTFSGEPSIDEDVRFIDIVNWCMQGLAINDLARDGKAQKDQLVDLFLMLAERAYGAESERLDE